MRIAINNWEINIGKRSDNLGPADDFWYNSLGYKSKSGIDISVDKAMTCGAVYACVTLLARTVAMLPLKLYKRLSNGGLEPAINHPLYHIVSEQPNPEMTAYNFRETLQGHLGARGNAFAKINMNSAGNVIELLPLAPNKMTKKRINEKIIYQYRDDKGKTIFYNPNEILHIPGFGFDGLIGYSPITLMRETIGLTMATEQFGAEFFGNGANFGNTLKHPAQLSPKAKANLLDSIKAAKKDGSHGIYILEEGLEWIKQNFSPEDSQFILTRQQNTNDVARFYHIPPHMINELSHATFSNIEQQDIEFAKYTMMPWFVLWEQCHNAQLLSMSEQKRYTFKFNLNALLRSDAVSRAQFYNTMFNIGAFSPNKILDLEDQNAIDGGDKHFVPLNMIELESAGNPQIVADKNIDQKSQRILAIRGQVDKQFFNLFVDSIGKIMRCEAREINKILEKYTEKYLYLEKIDEYFEKNEKYFNKCMMPIYLEYCNEIGKCLLGNINGELKSNQNYQDYCFLNFNVIRKEHENLIKNRYDENDAIIFSKEDIENETIIIMHSIFTGISEFILNHQIMEKKKCLA